jgi:hypothetical protein
MEIHALNLKRLPEEGEGKLLDWLRFLKAETEEEFKMLSEKSLLINEAYCKLQVMSEDEANRMIYEARLKAQRDDRKETKKSPGTSRALAYRLSK